MLKKRFNITNNIAFTLMALPAFVYIVMFNYIPLGGNIIAFKNYNFVDGIFGSEWCGFDNFKYVFATDEIWKVIGRTIGYHLVTLILLNLVGGAVFALFLYEIKNNKLNRFYQTASLIPSFISAVVIGYIGYIFLNFDSGVMNNIIKALGLKPIAWYSQAKYWPFIIVIFNIWKSIGMAALYMYAALIGIDYSLFEAADIDGAGKLKKIWYISIPELMPMACIVLITQLGGILNANFDLFYNLPMNSEALYPATDVLSTYLYRGLAAGNFTTTAAVGLFQSVVGFVLIVTTNSIIKKLDPEKAMF